MNNKVGGARDQHLLTVTAGGQCGHLGSGHSGHTLSVVTKHGCVTSSHCVTARSVTRYRALNTDSPIVAWCLIFSGHILCSLYLKWKQHCVICYQIPCAAWMPAVPRWSHSLKCRNGVSTNYRLLLLHVACAACHAHCTLQYCIQTSCSPVACIDQWPPPVCCRLSGGVSLTKLLIYNIWYLIIRWWYLMSPCGGKGGGEGVEMAKVLHQLTRLASTSCRPPPTSALGCSARTWWPTWGLCRSPWLEGTVSIGHWWAEQIYAFWILELI